MEKKKTRLSVCGILASLIFFVAGWKLLMTSGVARDNQIYVRDFFSLGLWVVLFGSVLLFFLTWLYHKSQRIPFGLALGVFLLFVCYALVVCIGWKISFEELREGRELLEAAQNWLL
ncbi:hypothetical protein [Hominifimenecus sp. rT4P-3]|uniref:hypothetical protein n=1 Tax=Hominifimenecus sp. rT4P-3 TaxID=3242979 RepID=UPI003DA22C44